MSEKEKYPSELAERFQIRLTPGLRDRIRTAAEKNSRSMNTEIIMALEDAFPPEDQFLADLSLIDEIDEIAQRLERIRATRIAEEIAKGRAEVRDLDGMIEKADEILKKPKKK